MRLSDIKGERTLDVIADLVEPIANIVQDGSVAPLFTPQKPKKGQTPAQAFVERVRLSVPSLLRTHREDLIVILSTIKGVSQEEYIAQMTLSNVIGDVYELLTDEEFLAFLPSSE